MMGEERPRLPPLPGLGSPMSPPPSRNALSLNTGRLQFPDDPTEYNFTAEDLEDLGEIGRGNYGTVNKMRHKATQRLMAVKRIRSHTVNKTEQQRLIRELETVMNAQQCDYIIKFFGAIFYEGDCWICMELMDLSLDMLYKAAFTKGITIPEYFVGHIAVSAILALSYLKDNLKIIHRDVKPSNIVLNRRGDVKLVDFGIAGELVDSIAKTQDVGCKPYMAPERVSEMKVTYDVRSDIWSLGITLKEIVTGRFPYEEWSSPFEQLSKVVDQPAPILTEEELPEGYSWKFIIFVNKCLTKEKDSRPKYRELQNMEFFQAYAAVVNNPNTRVRIGKFVSEVMDAPMTENDENSC